MLAYLLKATFCWSLFYILYHLWLEKETFFKINRWYLLTALLSGLIIPAIDFQWLIPAHQEPEIVHYLQPISVGVDQLQTVIVTASTQEAGVDWWNVLLVVYWVGVAVTLSRFLWGLSKINRLYHTGKKSGADGYRFVHTSTFHIPFSFFKNLFWSQRFEVDEEDKQNILRHEEAHIFQWHSLDVILLEITAILLWFNPLIYLYQKAIKPIMNTWPMTM